MTALNSYLEACPLVAILRGVRPEEVGDIGQELANAGFAIIEVPLNSPDPLHSIEILADSLGDKVLIGAGTVIDPTSVEEIEKAGGRIIVMPHSDVRVVERAKERGLIALPGFATPSEAFAALDAGADGLKLFPAEANPPGVLKAMRAVLPPEVPVLPVGGISPDRMAGYFDAGATGFGLGSALYKPGMTAGQVARNAHTFIEALKS